MKRITNLMDCVCISAAGYAQTFLSPMHPDMALPVAASGDVYLPIKTSAYSYENVIFDMSGFGVGFWFCTTNSNYIATRLQNDDTTFVTPLAAGIYNNIALYPGMTTVSPGARLSFSRRNRDNRLFMAYPLPGFSGGGGNLDMRSKFVPWASPAFRPTNITDVDKNTGISIQPNPFTNVVTLEIVDYNNELLCVSVTDIQGRIVATIEGQLESVNRQMEDVSVRLTAGIYIVNIHSDTYHQAMKIVKQ